MRAIVIDQKTFDQVRQELVDRLDLSKLRDVPSDPAARAAVESMHRTFVYHLHAAFDRLEKER